MTVVVTGSLAYDYIMSFPGRFVDHILPQQLHTLSVSFLVDSLRRERGGIAANIAYNLCLLGVRPYLMCTAGKDPGRTSSFHIWIRFPQHSRNGKVWQIMRRLYRFYFINE